MTDLPEPAPTDAALMIPWRDAWQEALYGTDGFYRRDEGPAGHFATSSQGIPGVDEVLAQAILASAERIGAEVVVDFACGRGELLQTMARFVDAELELVGVDVVERPHDLDERITWVRSPGGAAVPSLDAIDGRRALVVAHEWLDVVPCVVAEADADGVLREVLVSPGGDERLGAALASDDARWAARHAPPHPSAACPTPAAIPAHTRDFRPRSPWPAPDDVSPPPHHDVAASTSNRGHGAGARHDPGERVEIGSTRDAAWARLVAEVERHAAAGSVVIGIDYAYDLRSRPPFGTLTGFRDGGECSPVPDGSCDVTAHVALDSLDVVDVRTQHDVLLELFGTEPLDPVPVDLATSDPPTYLARLAARSALGAATHSDGLGAFAWFTRSIG